MAEWLGKALQKLLQRFESARDLQSKKAAFIHVAFLNIGYYPTNLLLYMQTKKILHFAALLACVALVAVCFMPWIHNTVINQTFTGYDVKKFVTGTTLGRAGIPITILTGLSFILTALPYVAAKRANMFVCALLVSYTLRTYVVFTGALFEGEIVKLAGIYLINILSIFLVICSVFPYLKKEERL